MLRVLQFVLVDFQRFPKPVGSSTRHERDMERQILPFVPGGDHTGTQPTESDMTAKLKLLASDDLSERNANMADAYSQIEGDIYGPKVLTRALQEAVMNMDHLDDGDEHYRKDLGILMANIVRDKAKALHEKYQAK